MLCECESTSSASRPPALHAVSLFTHVTRAKFANLSTIESSYPQKTASYPHLYVERLLGRSDYMFYALRRRTTKRTAI